VREEEVLRVLAAHAEFRAAAVVAGVVVVAAVSMEVEGVGVAEEA